MPGEKHLRWRAGPSVLWVQILQWSDRVWNGRRAPPDRLEVTRGPEEQAEREREKIQSEKLKLLSFLPRRLSRA